MSEPSATPAVDDHTQVSHEQDGRVLTGTGVTAESLAETMDRHAPEPAAPKDSAVETPTPAEPVTRGRQRFSDLTRERDEAKAKADAAEARAAAAEKEREELRARAQPREPERPADPVKPATEPFPETFPAFDAWLATAGNEAKTFEDFLDARADWRYDQRREAERVTEAAQQAERAQRDDLAAYLAQVKTIEKEHPDFDTVIAAAKPISKVLEHASIKAGPKVAYYLATHPDEAEALTQDTLYVSPDNPAFPAAVSAMKRYISTLITAPPPVAPKAPAWTPPPPPPPMVGASSPTTPTSSAELANKGHNFDESGYREKRAAERGMKPRRW